MKNNEKFGLNEEKFDLEKKIDAFTDSFEKTADQLMDKAGNFTEKSVEIVEKIFEKIGLSPLFRELMRMSVRKGTLQNAEWISDRKYFSDEAIIKLYGEYKSQWQAQIDFLRELESGLIVTEEGKKWAIDETKAYIKGWENDLKKITNEIKNRGIKI